MPIDWRMDKEDVTHTHTHTHTHVGILLNNQKEWNLAICNDMDGTGVYYAIMLSEISQTEKDKYHMIPYDFTHVNLINKT